jgi:hypothetical protein
MNSDIFAKALNNLGPNPYEDLFEEDSDIKQNCFSIDDENQIIKIHLIDKTRYEYMKRKTLALFNLATEKAYKKHNK